MAYESGYSSFLGLWDPERPNNDDYWVSSTTLESEKSEAKLNLILEKQRT